MKKMFTCLAAIGMMLTMVPANAVYAADTAPAAVTAVNDDTYYEVKEELASGISVAALEGFWNTCNNSSWLIITKGSDLNHGKFSFKKMDTLITGTVRLEYTLNSDNTKMYFYNFYEDNGKLWNSYYASGEIPLNSLDPGQNSTTQFLRRLFRGKVVTESGDLNLRSSSSTDSEIMTVIPRDTVLNIYAGDRADWYRTEYLGNTGYVSAEFIRNIETPAAPVDIKEYVGKWIYEVSDGNHIVEEGSYFNGTVEIKEDGSYTYTDADGKVTTGTVNSDYDEYSDGSYSPIVMFYENSKFSFGGHYDLSNQDWIYIGNGGMTRLVRDKGEYPEMKALAGKWKYQAAVGNGTVDKGSKDSGTVEIKADGTYSFTDADEKVKTGKVRLGSETVGGARLITVSFKDSTDILFGGYYRSDSPDEIAIGNGGTARLVRDNEVKPTLCGDANCDKKVDLSDAVLIMQCISNPSKYSENGSDKNRITSQGKANADCFNTGDGVTNADALSIQKYKLSLITSLPEKK